MKTLSKKERKELLRCIKKASGVAQYALEVKMTDEQLVEASKHLEILSLIKDANNYNRRHQGLNTQKVNKELTDTQIELTEVKRKLEEFLNIENSEILKAGRWLMDALSLTGSDRKQALLERELLHKEDYNGTVSAMGDTIETVTRDSEQAIKDAEETIRILEQRIDTLRGQLSKVQEYISNNYSAQDWRMIKDTFNIN